MDISKVNIFRILHIDNLEYILRTGKLTTYKHADADTNYKNIGEGELINLRAEHKITTFGSKKQYSPSNDFLPFYFASRSVMLYRIKTGYNVKQIHQTNIIYMVYRLKDIIDDIDYLFTDGHGYAKFTRWFDNIEYLNEVDWKMIYQVKWNNTEDDSDRERRKQAEFWVKNELSLEKIAGIAVFDEAALEKVTVLCNTYQPNIPIRVVKDYYYQ